MSSSLLLRAFLSCDQTFLVTTVHFQTTSLESLCLAFRWSFNLCWQRSFSLERSVCKVWTAHNTRTPVHCLIKGSPGITGCWIPTAPMKGFRRHLHVGSSLEKSCAIRSLGILLPAWLRLRAHVFGICLVIFGLSLMRSKPSSHLPTKPQLLRRRLHHDSKGRIRRGHHVFKVIGLHRNSSSNGWPSIRNQSLERTDRWVETAAGRY